MQQVSYVNDAVTTSLMTLVHSVFFFCGLIQQCNLLHHVKGDHFGLLVAGGAICILFFINTTSVSPVSPKLPPPHWRECVSALFHGFICASTAHKPLSCASASRYRTLPLPLHIVWIHRSLSVFYATAPFICLSVLL